MRRRRRLTSPWRIVRSWFLRDLGVADAQRLGADGLDQGTRRGVLAARVPEGAAARGHVGGLLLVAPLLQLAHPGEARRLVHAVEDPGPFQEQALLVVQAGVAVLEAEVRVGPGLDLAARPQHAALDEALGDLDVVGAGVHGDGAADRAGHADHRLQATQAVLQALDHHLRQGQPRLGVHAVVREGDAREVVGQADHQAGEALVGDQQVAAAADHGPGQAGLAGPVHGLDDLLDGRGLQEVARRAAHVPGREGRQRHVLAHVGNRVHQHGAGRPG